MKNSKQQFRTENAIVQTKGKTIYLSIRQTARQTGIAESFLRSAVKDKKIPGFYSGKKFLINVPRLLAILEEQSD